MTSTPSTRRLLSTAWLHPTHWLICAQVPDPEQGDQLRPIGHTKKSQRRRAATRAVRGVKGGPTCLQVGATALEEAIARRAGDSATLAADALVAVARALDAAAKDLHAAPRRSDESEDAHMMYCAAECRWRAARAVADVSGNAAVASARALVEASKAVDAAAKRVVADVEPDVKLAARRDLEEAEAAFESLYDPAKARRPRPTSRAARRRPTARRRRRRRAAAASQSRTRTRT